MKNWNPSRAPNAIAIRNLSEFPGRHYCRWLTKRGIGTISWVRSTDSGNALRVLARPVRLAFDSVASSFTLFLPLPFLPSPFLYSPWNSSRDAPQQSRPLVFHAMTIYFRSAVRNGDRKWWQWRFDIRPRIFFSRIFFDSSLITGNFSSLVFLNSFLRWRTTRFFTLLFNLDDYVISFSKVRVRNL